MPESYIPQRPTSPNPRQPYLPGRGTTKPPAAILEPIELAKIWEGGYQIRVNHTAGAGEDILLKVGAACINITKGYGTRQMPALLNSLAWKGSWAETARTKIPCRALVVQPCGEYPVPGATYLQVMTPDLSAPFGQYYKILIESVEQTLDAPVIPLERLTGRGATALVPVGTAEPRAHFGMPGRLLSKDINERAFFTHGGYLETDPMYRQMDCTTYVMSCYRAQFGLGVGGDGKVMCRKLGATIVTRPDASGNPQPMDKVPGGEAKAFLKSNRGPFIVLKYSGLYEELTGHVMAFYRGVIHEFSILLNRYRTISVDEKLGDELYYSIYRMP